MTTLPDDPPHAEHHDREPLPHDPPPPPGYEDPLEGADILADLTLLGKSVETAGPNLENSPASEPDSPPDRPRATGI